MNTYLKSFISPATKSFIRSAWKSQVHPPWDFLHSFVYARWPYKYIALANADHGLIHQIKQALKTWRKGAPKEKPQKRIGLSPAEATGTMADIYHGKVMLLEDARKLVIINEAVNMPDLEQVIPFQRARALILENPKHILQVKCPCRMARKTPCEPLDVCLVVGEPFTSLIYQHYPSRSKWISAQTACEILERENDRGRVHHAYFSELMLGRFFAICNCCACCCTAMKSHQRGTPLLAPSGYLAQVEDGICSGCFECVDYCQFGAIKEGISSIMIDRDMCMGCGVCARKCPMDAIKLQLNAAKGVPLDILSLTEPSAIDSISIIQ